MIELFSTFFKLGLFTIGGGVAMIPILRNIMVNDKRWFSEEEMMDIITICQSLPGVIAINMATYVGFKRRGLLGSFVATVGVILPSFVLIALLARGIDLLGGNPLVQGALGGLRAAALGLMVLAVFQVAKSVVRDRVAVLAAILCFAAVVWLRLDVAYVILAFLLAGILCALVKGRRSGGDAS